MLNLVSLNYSRNSGRVRFFSSLDTYQFLSPIERKRVCSIVPFSVIHLGIVLRMAILFVYTWIRIPRQRDFDSYDEIVSGIVIEYAQPTFFSVFKIVVVSFVTGSVDWNKIVSHILMS